MMMLFGDASYFIALFNAADPHHFMASRFRRELHCIVTTNLVVTEFLNATAKGHTRLAAAGEVRDWLSNPTMHVVDCDRPLLIRAIRLYEQRLDKNWGLADCASFVVMDDLGIRQALTADHHHVQAGFGALLPLSK
jgi:predicted nucleic acid-binding protein